MENELVATVGEGESGLKGERSIHIYEAAYARWITGEKLLWSAGSPGQLCDDHGGWEALEGGDRRGEGGR